jgi:hypothetical protein
MSILQQRQQRQQEVADRAGWENLARTAAALLPLLGGVTGGTLGGMAGALGGSAAGGVNAIPGALAGMSAGAGVGAGLGGAGAHVANLGIDSRFAGKNAELAMDDDYLKILLSLI